MLAILLESTETRCILSWMRMNLGRIGCGSLCFKYPRKPFAGSDAENVAAVSFMQGGGLRLIGLMVVRSGAGTEIVSGNGSCLPLHKHVTFAENAERDDPRKSRKLAH